MEESKDFKEKIIDTVASSERFLREEEIRGKLVSAPEESPAFSSVLSELVAAGALYRTRKGKYALPERLGYLTGELEVKRGGFAFVIAEDGDIYVSADNKYGALNGDTVLVKLMDKGTRKNREGRVERIVKFADINIVGVLDKGKNAVFVVPDDPRYEDIFIPRGESLDAKNGQKVVARITKRSRHGRSAEGKIIEVLGYPGEKGVDILGFVRQFDLPDAFDAVVDSRAEEIVID